MKNQKKWDEQMKDKDSFEKKLDIMHTDELGLGMPEDYFSKSKNDILEKINSEKKSKVIPIYKNKVVWFAAAGIAFILALTVFKPDVLPDIGEIPSIVSDSVDQIKNFDLATINEFVEEDVLIASLFVDESQIDTYIDNYIIEETFIDEYIDNYIMDDLLDAELIFN